MPAPAPLVVERRARVPSPTFRAFSPPPLPAFSTRSPQIPRRRRLSSYAPRPLCLPAAAAGALRTLPPTPTAAPRGSGFLRTSSTHSVYYEVHGAPDGFPALVVHGGPGAGCFLNHLRFFDLSHYCVILLDQRGCGRSSPRGCLLDNNTDALVSDMELLRHHLGVERWLLLGGSWGVALSLAYALEYPSRVAAMVLRGVCTMRRSEVDWMFGGGAGHVKPWAWARFLEHLHPHERSQPLLSYYSRLLSADSGVRDAAARSWMEWEAALGSRVGDLYSWDGARWATEAFPPAAPPPPRSTLSLPLAVGDELRAAAAAAVHRDDAVEPREDNLEGLIARGLSFRGGDAMSHSVVQALLTCHYSVHGAFFDEPLLPLQLPHPADQRLPRGGRAPGLRRGGPGPGRAAAPGGASKGSRGYLLSHAHELAHIPTIAVQGQDDLICPPTTAYELHRAWPQLHLRLVPRAGHSMYDPAITHELLEATDALRSVCKPQRAATAVAAA